MKKFIVEEKQKLKIFTDNHYGQGSYYWNYLMKEKEVRINGKKIGIDILLYPGDIVEYYLPKEKENLKIYEKIYEDNNLIVIDKESGVNSEAVFSALLVMDKNIKFIHRLDRNTMGIMIFAKNETAEKELLKLIKERKVIKKYLALCEGHFNKSHEKLISYLVKDEINSFVKIYDKLVAQGEQIITEYSVIQNKNSISLVEVILHTGKTHQIRAHMAYIGHPVVGDMKYGNVEMNKKLKKTRQCLISKIIILPKNDLLGYQSEKVFVSKKEFNMDY